MSTGSWGLALDLVLPDSEGLNTLLGIQEVTKTPILVLTGKEDMKLHTTLVQKGAMDVIIKGSMPSVKLLWNIWRCIQCIPNS